MRKHIDELRGWSWSGRERVFRMLWGEIKKSPFANSCLDKKVTQKARSFTLYLNREILSLQMIRVFE
jgi:hypothetical protein